MQPLFSGAFMRRLGAGLQVAQCRQFEFAWRRCFVKRLRELHHPATGLLHLLARDAWMQRHDGELLAHRVRLPDGEVGDQQRRPGRIDAKPLAMVPTVAMAERGEEIDLFDHAAPGLRHGDVDFLRRAGDLRRAAAAGQPCLGMKIVADDRGVDVAELVELGSTQEADGDAAALQPVAEHFRHRDGGDGGFAQFAITDRQRQHLRSGADRAALIDQRDVRRMRQARHVAGGGRRADAHEADIVIPQRTAGGDGHHLVGVKPS